MKQTRMIPFVTILIFSSVLLLNGCMYQEPPVLSVPQAPPGQRGPATDKYPPFELPKLDFSAAQKEIEKFEAEITPLVKKRDFRGLEEKARELAETKTRFIGGGWKIHGFIDVAVPDAVATPTGTDWKATISYLEDWNREIPDSIIPRVALAEVYRGQALEARGNGWAKDVPKEALKVFQERLTAAEAELAEAAKVSKPDHSYYEALLAVALSQNWDPASTRRIFDDAIKFEPDYQYFYGQYAVSLMPRWGGKPGEWEAFAENVKQTRGLQMYFSIVAEVARAATEDFFTENKVSWQDAKEGFRLLIEKHGANKIRINEFAKMALLAKDTQMACGAFKQIPDDGKTFSSVWESRAMFERAKSAAEKFCSIPRFANQAE